MSNYKLHFRIYKPKLKLRNEENKQSKPSLQNFSH